MTRCKSIHSLSRLTGRAAALLIALLFCCGFSPRRGQSRAAADPVPDSLAALYAYTDGIRLLGLEGDTTAGRQALRRAIECDSTYAPALFMLSTGIEAEQPVLAHEYARRAYLSDTTNKWYAQHYGRMLVINGRYGDAATHFEKVMRDEPDNPDNYRMLALLYQQQNKPFSALVILDSAEVRFGRISALSEIKRGLLIGTRQYDKAVAEAEAMVAAEPYDAGSHIALGELYGAVGRDSLALAELNAAIKMDSTDLRAQLALGDYWNRRQDYRRYLAVTKEIFRNDAMPAADKVQQLKRITSDRDFYRSNYLQIDELVRTLAMKYPDDRDVMDAYALHLIASGELDDALELYKRRLAAGTAEKEDYDTVIDIESYKRREDSTAKYVALALKRFPHDPSLYIRKGSASSVQRRYDDAVRNFRRALAVAGTDTLRSVIRGYIGDTYQMQASEAVNPERREHFPGLFREMERSPRARALMKRCFAEYDRALALWGDNAAVLNNYAYFLAEQERETERAVEMSEHATKADTNNPTYLDTYAWALHKAGRTAEAKRVMQQALSLDRSDSAELQVHYGDILDALGERFMAEIYWRRAQENGYPEDAIARRMKRTETDDRR